MSGSGISWDICKSAPCSRQITMPAPHHSVFYRPDALPATQPIAPKHWRQLPNNNKITITSRWWSSYLGSHMTLPAMGASSRYLSVASTRHQQLLINIWRPRLSCSKSAAQLLLSIDKTERWTDTALLHRCTLLEAGSINKVIIT